MNADTPVTLAVGRYSAVNRRGGDIEPLLRNADKKAVTETT
jgi:hypothetical protein